MPIYRATIIVKLGAKDADEATDIAKQIAELIRPSSVISLELEGRVKV